VPYTPDVPASGAQKPKQKDNTMTKENLLRKAAIPGLIALTAFLLLVCFPFKAERADRLVGFGSVIVLLGIAGLEYRVSFKRLFGR